ncbi:hypothetical protein SAMN04488518_1221, partial [Pseudovibrio ascidiaceicola]
GAVCGGAAAGFLRHGLRLTALMRDAKQMILDVVVAVWMVVQRKLMAHHQVNGIGGAMTSGGFYTGSFQPVLCERLANTISLVTSRILIERIISGRAVVFTALMGVLLVVWRVLE